MTNELTLENIRSGAFPSDAHAVGFLLGEIERLTRISLAARALLKYIDDHDWGLIPEGQTADTLRDLLKGEPTTHEPSEQLTEAEKLLQAWADLLPPNGRLYWAHVEKAREYFRLRQQGTSRDESREQRHEVTSIDDVAAICHSVTGLCCHILGSPGGPCTIGNCAAVRGYLGGPEFAQGASRDASSEPAKCSFCGETKIHGQNCGYFGQPVRTSE